MDEWAASHTKPYAVSRTHQEPSPEVCPRQPVLSNPSYVFEFKLAIPKLGLELEVDSGFCMFCN